MDNGQLIIDNGQLPHVEHVETKHNGINNNHRNVKHRNTASFVQTQNFASQ